MYKLMLVEDDPVITEVLCRRFAQWGFEVVAVTQFDRVFSEFIAIDPQLVLMDIFLPFYDGYHWCEQIRMVSKVPVLFVSSASDKMNLVMALGMGADDFIAKPFDFDVLLAKVQALLRRAYAFGSSANFMELGGIVLNTSDATLSYNGQKLELTKNDLKLLQILFENRGQAVSREAIMQKLWESDSFIDDNTLTVNITRLRKKLAELGLSNLIVTKKGLGYLVEDEVL